jgi:SAM-dependent methyltransferase
MPYDEPRADRYDAAYPDAFAQAGAVVDALAQLATNVPAAAGPARVLELGIGTGRLALPLAARGFDVWGVDDSEPMIARLRAKPGGSDVTVVAGDFADVESLVDGRFVLAFVAYNTLFELPTQDDQVRCFTGVARRLAPGGLFVVEAFVPDLTRLEQAVHAASIGDDHVTLSATRHDPLSQQAVSQNVVITSAGIELEPWTIRYASVPELDLMARLAGLRLKDRWGGWRRDPFTAASPTHVSVYELSPDG